MANTYSQLYIHVVFAVKRRSKHISEKWKDDLFRFITGIVTNKNQKLIIINGVADHIHILFGVKPNCILSDLVRDVKANSSGFINENGLVPEKFEWQIGFGAFSVGHSELNRIINYIKNQEAHHNKISFREEYIELLMLNEIDFKHEYIFEME